MIDLSIIQADAARFANSAGKHKTGQSAAANAPPKSKIKHQDVLSEILGALKPYDFHQSAGLQPNDAVPQKHAVVLTVREVLRVADSLDCGLCRNADFIYTYNGEFWQLLERDELESFFGAAAARLGVDDITASYHPFREKLYKQFLAVAHLPKPNHDDAQTLVNLQNGTFAVSSNAFEIRDFDRADFLTYRLPFGYDKSAGCPKWQQFLDEVLPDQDSQNVLAEFFGYIFISLKLEKTLLLYGTGANGKSVVFDVLTALLGEQNISHYSLASLKHDYQRAMLSNKLLNYASEISNRLESDVFKKLTSGEPVEARLPYGQPFIMRRYARLAFNCNELPRDVEHNEAFFRRFLIVPFTVTIAEQNRDPNLAKTIIATELSGVFNWLLAGLQRLLKQSKFTAAEAARNALDEYRKESDSVALFVEENGYEKIDDRHFATPLKTLYPEYKTFCQDYGFRPVQIQNLANRLRALGFDCPKTNKGILVYALKS